MNLYEAKNLTESAMRAYGLGHWSFEWLRSNATFGRCYHGRQVIALSRPLVELNNETKVGLVIIHEIAHALVGAGHGHDAVWRRQCLSMGGDGRRCHDEVTATARPPHKWIGTCPQCGWQLGRDRLTQQRRTNTICTPCARKIGKPYTTDRTGHIHLRWQENFGRVRASA